MTDDSPDIERLVCSTHKWTFSVPQIRNAVESHLEGDTLNLFAGDTRLSHDDQIIRNDIDPELEADYHFDATEVGSQFERNTFDTVILDPPFSIRNATLKYDGNWVSKWKLVADGVWKVVRPGGMVISLGHNSTGLGKVRGFAKEKLYIFNHKGGHHDTFCLVERQMNQSLEQPWEQRQDLLEQGLETAADGGTVVAEVRESEGGR